MRSLADKSSCRALVALTMVLVCGLPTGSATADDVAFVRGLRQRRLFELAETFCQRQLQQANIAETARVDLTIELMRCYAEHAVQSTPEQQLGRWQQARQVAADFAAQHPQHPRALLVQVQDALTVLAQGELGRQEIELAIGQETDYEQPLAALREAVRLLDDLQEPIDQAIREAERRRSADAGLTSGELVSLLNNVRYQLARAYRNRALCYPPESADRLAALNLALEQLRTALTQLAEDSPLVEQIRLDEVACLRLQQNLPAAQQALARVVGQSSGFDNPAWVAEALRLAAASQQWPQLADLVRKLPGQSSSLPDVDLARAESLIALWQNSAGEQAAQWQQAAVQWVEQVEQWHGPYWGRRADLMLVRAAGRNTTAPMNNVALLVRTADNLYLQGQLDQARQTYREAARVAGEAGDSSTAFQMDYKAALVLQEQANHDQAGIALRQLAIGMPQLPMASEAHLLAAWNTAQAARSDAKALARYPEILSEHLERWPQADSANQIRVWLARWRQTENRWEEALQLYQQVDRQSAFLPDAVGEAAEAARRWLAGNRHAPALAEQAEGHAVFFESLLGQDANQGSTEVALAAAIGTARLRLISPAAAVVQRVAQQLTTALEFSQPAAAELAAPRATARALLVLAQAHLGQAAEAQQTLQQLQPEDSEAIGELVGGLATLPESAATLRSQLQLAAIAKMSEHLDQLDPLEQKRVLSQRAEALAEAGRYEQAVDAFQDLVQQHPDDGPLRRRLAHLLSAGSEAEYWRQALDQWRIIAARTPPHEDTWWQAKYQTALAQFQLGQRREAAERIRYLQATSGPGPDPWKQKLAELLKKCE